VAAEESDASGEAGSEQASRPAPAQQQLDLLKLTAAGAA